MQKLEDIKKPCENKSDQFWQENKIFESESDQKRKK